MMIIMNRIRIALSVAGIFLLVLSLVVTQATSDTVENVDSESVCSQLQQSQLQEAESPYVIIIDGGSTGSRLHIFEFLNNNSTDHNQSATSAATVTVQRRGSTRVDSPLSAWGPTHDQPYVDPDAVAQHLYPLLAYAAPRIPHCFHNTTSIHYAATAGMRLLTETAQEQVYSAAVEGLLRLQAKSSSTSGSSSTFQFSKDRLEFATLSGELEGYYGAVAANYLHQNMDMNHSVTTNTNTSDNHSNSNDKKMILGALDMGGASAQVVYPHPSSPSSSSSSSSSGSESMDEQTCVASDRDHVTDDSNNKNNNSCSATDNFFSVSYLSYGVDQFRERLWNLLIWEHMQQQQQRDDDGEEDASCDAGYVENPCLNPGFTVPWEYGYTLLGTGDAAACQQQVRRLLPHPHAVVDPDEINNSHSNIHNNNNKRVVGGIEHPPIPPGQRFVAQSLYFFTLDSLRQFSGDTVLNTTWPTPTLTELDAALPQLCQRDWDTDLRHAPPHRFTSSAAMPHRCFESVYLLQLLQHGLGLDPHARDILFAYELNDSEVEWTLGMALSMRRRRQRRDMVAKSSSSSTSSSNNNNISETEQETTISTGAAESNYENPISTSSNAKVEAAAAVEPREALSDFSTTNETNTPTTAPRARWMQFVAEVLVSNNVGFVSTSGSYATLR